MSGPDIGASVRARLLNKAKTKGQDFSLILTRYALERFLYRLGTSAHGERFLLKGALLFDLWFDGNSGDSIQPPSRTWRDRTTGLGSNRSS